jgi:hypothetical protein
MTENKQTKHKPKLVKTGYTSQGSVLVLIFWLIFCFPIGILYWLFRLKRTKNYEYQ